MRNTVESWLFGDPLKTYCGNFWLCIEWQWKTYIQYIHPCVFPSMSGQTVTEPQSTCLCIHKNLPMDQFESNADLDATTQPTLSVTWVEREIHQLTSYPTTNNPTPKGRPDSSWVDTCISENQPIKHTFERMENNNRNTHCSQVCWPADSEAWDEHMHTGDLDTPFARNYYKNAHTQFRVQTEFWWDTKKEALLKNSKHLTKRISYSRKPARNSSPSFWFWETLFAFQPTFPSEKFIRFITISDWNSNPKLVDPKANEKLKTHGFLPRTNCAILTQILFLNPVA